MTVVMEMGKLMGVLLGLLQVCVQFKVPSYRDCRSAVSACVLRVENEYLFCNFFPPFTRHILKLMQAYFCFQEQTKKDQCLLVISLAFLPLFVSLCKSLIRFWTLGHKVLDVLSIE